jgi:lipopolysaccharide transport system permease protein
MSRTVEKPLNNEKVTIYNRNTNLGVPTIKAVWFSLRDIWFYRWLIWVNFKKDFVGQYKRSSLAIMWTIVMPLIPLTAYLFLAFIRALNVTSGLPYPVYIISGMTIWLILSEGITSAMGAVNKERSVLTKVKIPLITVIMAGYGKVCANTLIRIPFLVLVFIIFHIYPPPITLLFPLVLLPIIFLGLGFGIIFGMLGAMTQDAENAVAVLMRYGMFLCSVVFAMPTDGLAGTLNRLNIFNHLVVGLRDFLVYGTFSDPSGFAAGAVISVLVFIIALKWNYSLEYLAREAL